MGNNLESTHKLDTYEGMLDYVCKEISKPDNYPNYDTTSNDLPFIHLWIAATKSVHHILKHHCKFTHARQSLTDWLLTQLCRISKDVLWELFQQERGIGKSALAAFTDQQTHIPPEQKQQYISFIEKHRNDRLRCLFSNKPVLAEHIGDTIYMWAKYSAEILKNINADRSRLSSIFNIPTTAELKHIALGEGDLHCCGKSVAKLEFQLDTQHWYLMYKPRDLSIDYHYQELLIDPVVNGEFKPLTKLKVLCGGDYGYMEYINHQPCETIGELREFYFNAGRQSALLYLLGCSDGHYENLIAHKTRLHFIDGETLFTPVIDRKYIPPQSCDWLQPESELETRKNLENSIISTELFPSWTFTSNKEKPTDYSAFGADTQQKTIKTLGWKNINSDIMYRQNVIRTTAPVKNNPAGSNAKNPYKLYTKEFFQGFEKQCLMVLNNRHKWLMPEGILDQFKNCRRRHVQRATRIYAAIQEQQFSEKSLASYGFHEQTLKTLSRLYQHPVPKDKCWHIFLDEKRQMARRDIPYFEHKITSTTLLLSDNTVVSHYFKTSGIDLCRQRIKSLTTHSISQQKSIIKTLISVKKYSLKYSPPLKKSPLSLNNNLDIAQHIEKICSMGRGQFLGFDLGPDGNHFVYQPLGMSLLSGKLGIALFLASLKNDQLLLTTINIVRMYLDSYKLNATYNRKRWWRGQLLGLCGSGGQLLALSILKDLKIESDSIEQVVDHLLKENIETKIVDASPNIINGASGLLGALISLKTDRSLSLAEEIGKKLVNWTNTRDKIIDESGFAFGRDGIIAALSALYRVFKKDIFADALNTLIELERSNIFINQTYMKSNWSCGASGKIISLLCLANSDFFDTSTKEEIAKLRDIALTFSKTESNLFNGSYGEIATLQVYNAFLGIKCNSQQLFPKQNIDTNNLGLMTGLAGCGLTMTISPRANYIKKSILSGGLL